jgi:hypothetical protein
MEHPTSNFEWEKNKETEISHFKLNCGVKRHHYSMFNVGRSMFDVQLFCHATICS